MNPDVIIIGAGVIGAACAYFLSLRGAKVLVLERNHLCAGASGVTASVISIGGTSGTPEPLQPFNIESHRLIEEIEADFTLPLQKISGGSLFVALNEQEAQEIRIKNHRIDHVVTDRGDYRAEWVVVAAGAWTPQVLPSVRIELPIVPARGQVINTEACAPMTQHSISFLNHVYLKQTGSGNFYLGSHTEYVGFENRITLEKLTACTAAPARAVPVLGRLQAIRFFAGFRPMSVDTLPVIGPVPDCPKLIIASGHGRTGMRYSASTGKAVSELVMDGKTELCIDAFSPRRFAKQPDC